LCLVTSAEYWIHCLQNRCIFLFMGICWR